MPTSSSAGRVTRANPNPSGNIAVPPSEKLPAVPAASQIADNTSDPLSSLGDQEWTGLHPLIQMPRDGEVSIHTPVPDLRQPSYPSGIHPNTVPSHTARDTPTGSPFADVLTVIDALSMELHRLRAELEPLKAEVMPLKAEVAALTRERISDKEQIESLRASLGDLEEIVFREISVSPKKKKDQKNTTAVDVPNRHRSMQHQAEFEQNSPEEDSASDEEDFPRPNRKGAAVTGLIEQVTRRPEFKNLVSYRTYRLSDTTQKANAAVSGNLNSKLKQL